MPGTGGFAEGGRQTRWQSDRFAGRRQSACSRSGLAERGGTRGVKQRIGHRAHDCLPARVRDARFNALHLPHRATVSGCRPAAPWLGQRVANARACYACTGRMRPGGLVIHFFLTFSDDASDSPFARALRDLGVEHRIFSGKVLLRYRHRIWLLLLGLPRLAWFAARSVWRSLLLARPRPDAVVVGSHLEALAFVMGRAVLRRRLRIVLLGFIFTRRKSAWLDRLRIAYFGWLFSKVDMVLCHSTLEIARYDELFPRARGRFRFVPYGLHIHGYDEPADFQNPATAPALSAGRSGRDYKLLCDVFSRAGYPLRIVCDSEAALAGCAHAPNIEVLRHCYDTDYSRELRNAGMVVVPLAVDDISAGQMVLVQAMAYRKPLIVTRTPTVNDYLKHEVSALLVEPGSPEGMRNAIDRLRADPDLARRLTVRSAEAFEQRHSMQAFVENIVAALPRR
ncbi:MAG: hypothetical protein C0505_03555 [Leptothrix sp. (in: Bacteria)]|nr:hypothetical protein [Leptothrix sp. (in: b-proteobacteria)]